jgi:protein involved in polysaccharide export with SLBB domain
MACLVMFPFLQKNYQKMIWGLFLLFLCSFLPSRSISQQAFSEGTEPLVKAHTYFQKHQYFLGPGDILQWQVLYEPDFKEDEVLVRPDGTASFAGVGELDVIDLTVSDVAERIKQQLSQTIRDPQVIVSIKTMRPVTVYLSGAVMQPGMFQFIANPNEKNFILQGSDSKVRTDMRISNVLASSGGVNMNADLSNITIKWARSGEETHVNLWKVLKEGALDEDIWLTADVSINVPELQVGQISEADYRLLLASSIGPKTIPIRVLGQVKQPGVYTLDSTSPYLNSAIAKAGGMADAANQKVVAIRRFVGQDGSTTIFHNMKAADVILKPNDIVYISENSAYKTGRFTDVAFKVLSPFVSLSSMGALNAQVFSYGGWTDRFKR